MVLRKTLCCWVWSWTEGKIIFQGRKCKSVSLLPSLERTSIIKSNAISCFHFLAEQGRRGYKILWCSNPGKTLGVGGVKEFSCG